MKLKFLTFLAVLGLSINTFGASSMTPSVVDLPIVVEQVSNLTVEVGTKVSSNDLATTTTGSEGIRRVGALGGYTLEEFIEDTAVKGLPRDLPIFTYDLYPSTNLGGSIRITGVANDNTILLQIYKNGSLKSTLVEKTMRAGNFGETYTFTDITTNSADYYEVWSTLSNARSTTGSGADNWWSGQIVY